MQYDPAGNVLLKWYQGNQPVSMSYNAADQIVTSSAGCAITSYSFDRNGNMTLQNSQGSLTSYSFDPENRLAQVAFPNQTFSTYSFDGDGLRRNRQDPGGAVTLTIWDGQNYLQERE